MGKQITEWITEGSSFKPGQVMERSDAEEHGWDFWEFRSSKGSIKNNEWIKSELRRIQGKGLKAEIRRRLTDTGCCSAFLDINNDVIEQDKPSINVIEMPEMTENWREKIIFKKNENI